MDGGLSAHDEVGCCIYAGKLTGVLCFYDACGSGGGYVGEKGVAVG